MSQWGRPQRMRMDNGIPWGTASKFPSAFGLWLVGLGIELIYGRPARSTDNAVVERSHGVLNGWVDPQQCPDFGTCQRQVAWAVHTQRERYRTPGGQTRLQRYPQLRQNPRPYDAAMERTQWSLAHVADYLSGFRFQRKVEKNGRISLFANTYSVGKAYMRQYLEVYLDTTTLEWCICDEMGHPIRRHPAKELTYDQIGTLQLAKRRRKD